MRKSDTYIPRSSSASSRRFSESWWRMLSWMSSWSSTARKFRWLLIRRIRRASMPTVESRRRLGVYVSTKTKRQVKEVRTRKRPSRRRARGGRPWQGRRPAARGSGGRGRARGRWLRIQWLFRCASPRYARAGRGGCRWTGA